MVQKIAQNIDAFLNWVHRRVCDLISREFNPTKTAEAVTLDTIRRADMTGSEISKFHDFITAFENSVKKLAHVIKKFLDGVGYVLTANYLCELYANNPEIANAINDVRDTFGQHPYPFCFYT